MDIDLQRRITKVLNTETPLGPTDAHQIKDHEVAARLFDPQNASFNLLLRRDISVVIGRRGSGKTALLNSYLYRPYLTKHVLDSGNSEFDLNDYGIVVPILQHRMFERMQNLVAGPTGLLRPIESVIEDWNELITDYVLSNIWTLRQSKDSDDPNLQILGAYLNAPDTRKKAEAYRLIWGRSLVDSILSVLNRHGRVSGDQPTQEDALKACVEYLESRNIRAVAIFDSLDEYQTGEPRADRTVGALLRFVAQFNAGNTRIKIKLGLPAEIFPEIQRASANPLKDFVHFDQVRWTPSELAQIAAYRYRLFLQIYDPDHYAKLASINLAGRDGARQFWKRFFVATQVNRYGGIEGAMTYMMRHTQLLPRQLFRILHRVIRASHTETGGYRALTAKSVNEAIFDMESVIAGEIIQGFSRVYPYAENLAKAVFGNFPTVFTYDQLETKWRRVGRAMMRDSERTFELVNFTEMLLRMGILGVVEAETNRYIIGRFAYNMLMPFSIGHGQDLAIHPIYSRYFSCSGNSQKKSVLPTELHSNIQDDSREGLYGSAF
jgi:hypothetical protein